MLSHSLRFRPASIARRRVGDVLLSHRAAPAVSSGLEGLTTVFGMGTGVSPPLESPALLRAQTQAGISRQVQVVNERRRSSALGGDEGIRTPDPLVANQMLCQLSYAPKGDA